MIYELMAPQGWLMLLFLWFMFFWLYRDYRLDLFRQNLFAIRDDLFDMADNGELPFNSKAYGMLRSLINGNIQYGHQLGFLEILFFIIARQSSPEVTRNSEKFKSRWDVACKEISPEAVTKLNQIRDRLHLKLIEQVIFTSPVLFFSFVALLLFVVIYAVKFVAQEKLQKLLRNQHLGGFLTQFEQFAKNTSRLKAT